MLNTIDGLVTVNLFLRDRVLTVPIQQERETVSREIGRRRGEHLRAVTGIEGIGAITRYHVKERACKIAFVLIRGFIDCTDAGSSGSTEFAQTVVLRVTAETAERATDNTVGVVGAQVVDTCVRRIDVKQIRHHRTRTEPGLAHEVLFVPTVTDIFLRNIGM